MPRLAGAWSLAWASTGIGAGSYGSGVHSGGLRDPGGPLVAGLPPKRHAGTTMQHDLNLLIASLTDCWPAVARGPGA